jgi:oligo-1,6-glucosidase
MQTQRRWWKEASVYQIYPRSFMDSNGDGIGDIVGITQKLEYIKKLGIDLIWISPYFKSPNDDNGYDISDYRDIMDDFGTLDDWQIMIDKIHDLGMKLIMDLVVNHSSDEHDWFKASRSSKDSPYRDYYYWKKGKNGKEPNDWLSHFSGSAWQHDEITDEYYLHLFSKKQPDLNWSNPKVRREVYDIMEFWIEKGIDGFRMDVIGALSKAEGLPSIGNGKKYRWGGKHFLNLPKTHEYLKEMHREVLSKHDVMTVGETGEVTPDDAIKYTSERRKELDMVFQFEHMGVDDHKKYKKWFKQPFKLTALKKAMSTWQMGLKDEGWNSLYLGNHDQVRVVSRFGDDQQYRKQSAKMLATFLYTQKGTPYVYQGDEIGMTNSIFNSIEEIQDVETLSYYNDRISKGDSDSDLIKMLNTSSRDHARTPMQWNNRENGGFTTGKPWLKVNMNYDKINVEQALSDDDSIFYYYKALLKIRKDNLCLVYGKYEDFDFKNKSIYAFTRSDEQETFLTVCNFYKKPVSFDTGGKFDLQSAQIMISNYDRHDIKGSAIKLKPFESLVFKVK